MPELCGIRQMHSGALPMGLEAFGISVLAVIYVRSGVERKVSKVALGQKFTVASHVRAPCAHLTADAPCE
jgi:hypothetical protein